MANITSCLSAKEAISYRSIIKAAEFVESPMTSLVILLRL